MAMVIPVAGERIPGSERGPVVLVVILTKENLERMRESDPFDFQTKVYGPIFGEERLADLDLVIAYEEDEARIRQFAKTHDLKSLLSWLERGRRHRPGDATKPAPLNEPD